MANWSFWQKSILNILLGLLIGGAVYMIASQPRGKSVELDPIPTQALLTIHVTGEIKNPGVYQLQPGSRVADAIRAAGGLLSPANDATVNQAGLLRDGQQVYIGTSSLVAPTMNPVERRGMINLNTADVDSLMTLPGIGEVHARDIIKYREEKGGFKKVEELMDVNGIGQATFDKLKPYITVGE